MRKALKILLIIIVIIIILAGTAASYIALRSIPKYDVQKIDVKVELTPQRIQTGTKLASMLCRTCHYSEDTKKFTGRELTEAPQFGKIYTANITQDTIAGIGKWTDGDLIYFIRTGLKPDGQYVPFYMPKLIHISDEDLYSIVAFLRSDNSWVKADNTRQSESKPSFLTKFLVTIGAAKPFAYPKAPLMGPDTTSQVKWGQYIALYQLECYACHSKDFAKNDYYNPEKSPGFFAGGNKMFTQEGKMINSLNITNDKTTGISSWTEEQFVKAVKSGIVPTGEQTLRYPMIPYSNLSDEEVKAIYAYLQTVPPITNKVERKFDQ
ncbi:MAG: c-type cytochrome [Chitinophagaceae bacterium]|nr:c-type cytochrome [Chitinophagaceae bacterium]